MKQHNTQLKREVFGQPALFGSLALLTLAISGDVMAFGSSRPGPQQQPDVGVIVIADPAPQPAPVVVVTPAPAPVIGDDIDIDDNREGYLLGLRNGRILVDRLIRSTVGADGCGAVAQLQSALVRVARNLTPPDMGPDAEDEAFTLAFFEGYLRAIQEGVRATRQGCEALALDDGAFAGELYGSLLCSLTTVSVELASQLVVRSLYEGWSGGSADVISSCQTSIAVTLESCAGVDALTSLTVQVEQSCRD
ncbi:MAG: hypothetical protein IT285_05065 [Bdellovibrionales bacterium]|nr:hypothetical protein [Bdellovibrionales bacterium]